MADEDKQAPRKTTPKAKAQTNHATTVATDPDVAQQGGTWTVTCTCGWNKSDRYSRDRFRDDARRIATDLGKEHVAQQTKD
jgi:hypothetical protein